MSKQIRNTSHPTAAATTTNTSTENDSDNESESDAVSSNTNDPDPLTAIHTSQNSSFTPIVEVPVFDPASYDFASLRWADLVPLVQNHPRFAKDYSFPTDASWVKSRPFHEIKHGSQLPRVMALDCEMCETMDPVTEEKIANTLIRFSVVNGSNPAEVIFDSLVAPAMVSCAIYYMPKYVLYRVNTTHF